MTNHPYLYLQELRNLTDEVLIKSTQIREIIEEEQVSFKSLESSAEYLYKVSLNFKRRVYEVPFNGK